MNEEQLRTLNVPSSKERFIEAYTTAISRQGSKELLDWMLKTDFFTAPASSKFHSAYEGGLCDHSLNVYNAMIDRYNDGKPDESFAIVALLHDLCKAQFYKLGSRNVKNETTGAWEKVPFYTIDDKFPFGHGEKSVIILQNFLNLEAEEIMAIRCHMGGFDTSVKGGDFFISKVFERSSLAVLLHIADMKASYLRGE